MHKVNSNPACVQINPMNGHNNHTNQKSNAILYVMNPSTHARAVL